MTVGFRIQAEGFPFPRLRFPWPASPETSNQVTWASEHKPGTRIRVPATGNRRTRMETRNPESREESSRRKQRIRTPGTANQQPETGNREPEARSHF
jgi:hypothetical protein